MSALPGFHYHSLIIPNTFLLDNSLLKLFTLLPKTLNRILGGRKTNKRNLMHYSNSYHISQG